MHNLYGRRLSRRRGQCHPLRAHGHRDHQHDQHDQYCPAIANGLRNRRRSRRTTLESHPNPLKLRCIPRSNQRNFLLKLGGELALLHHSHVTSWTVIQMARHPFAHGWAQFTVEVGDYLRLTALAAYILAHSSTPRSSSKTGSPNDCRRLRSRSCASRTRLSAVFCGQPITSAISRNVRPCP